MKHSALAMTLGLAFSACATTTPSSGYGDNAAKLALYRAHATEQVGTIPFSGSIESWLPLGDRALAIWTSPSRAWLLELRGSCPDLAHTHAIGFDSRDGRISAGFDAVLALSPPGPRIPCRIDTIHRIDVAGLRAAERSQASGT